MMYTKQMEFSELAQVGIAPTPKNKVEIVTPFPLADLQAIIDGMNEYKYSGYARKTPDHFDVLGKGHFGTVFGYKGYAIKLVRGGQDSYIGYGDARKTDEILDAYVLRQLQSVPSIPRLYGVMDNEVIIMERVDGLTLRQYQDQMEDVEKMDNFIHPDYIKQHKEAIKDILMTGWIPHDLHMDNVMVCRQTGKPRIIDVGLFKKMEEDELELRGDTREGMFIRDFYSAHDALGYAQRLKQYVDEAKFPQLLEDRKLELIEKAEEKKRYRAREEERQKKREEERAKRRAEREAQRQKEIEAGIARVENDFEIREEGIIRWANLADFKPMPMPSENRWAKIHHNFFNPKPLFARPDIDIDIIKKPEKPENAEELIKQKKENQFKKGLHNMFKNDNIIMNAHKNKFAMGR